MKLLKNNWEIKLLSFVMAIIIWSFVIGNENPTVSTRITNVPIILENEENLSDDRLVLMSDKKIYTDVLISGKRNQIINITPNHIRVSADLKYLKEGVHSIKLKYNLPSGISLENEPQNINVNIEKLINKDFWVKVNTKGKLKENYILESTKANPEKVSILAARSIIESVKNVEAELNLDSLEDDVVTNLTLNVIDNNGKNIENLTLGQNFVNVNAKVLKSKEFTIKPEIKNMDKSSDYKVKEIKLNPNKIYLKGNKKYIDQIKEIKTQEIDVSNLKVDVNLPIKLNLPENTSPVNKDINVVANILIDEKIEKAIEIPKSNISILLTEGYSVSILNDRYYIYVKGFKEDLENVTYNDFKLTLDISGYRSGEYSIIPEVKTNKNLEILRLNNLNIKVE